MTVGRDHKERGGLTRIKRPAEIAGIILGIFLMVAGFVLVAFPKSGLIPRQDSEDGNFLTWVSTGRCQVCGVVNMVLGAAFVFASRWPRWGARRSAIDDYIWNLSQELARHLGTRHYYDIEEVSRIARGCGCDMAYIAYAHAMFCSRGDFDEYYGPLHVRCTYDGLRRMVGRDYFKWILGGFDAASVVRLARPANPEEDHFYDCGL